MKKTPRIWPPLVVFVLLLAPVLYSNSGPPVAGQLPGETETLVRASDPLGTWRRVAASRAYAEWRETAAGTEAKTMLSAIETPSLPVSILLGALKKVDVVTGKDGEESFSAVGADLRMLHVLFPLLRLVPGVEKDGGLLRVENQYLLPRTTRLWIGEKEALDRFARVADGEKPSLAERRDLAGFLIRNLPKDADASAILFSPGTITSAIYRTLPLLNTRVLLDEGAFAGAAAHLTMNENGLHVFAQIAEKPKRRFLRMCEPLDGAFAIPARSEIDPKTYLGLRVKDADRLADLFLEGFVGLGALGDSGSRGAFKRLFLRGFASTLGPEAAYLRLGEGREARLIAFAARDAAEVERYLRTLNKVIRRTGGNAAEDGVIPIQGTPIHFRIGKGLLVLGFTADDVEGFLNRYDADAANSSVPETMGELADDGCLLGFADIPASLAENPGLAWLADLAPRAGISARKGGATTDLHVELPFDNPMKETESGWPEIARAVFVLTGAVYAIVLLITGLTVVRRLVRKIRVRRAASGVEEK